MNFKVISSTDRIKFAPEAGNNQRLIADGSKYWFVKYEIHSSSKQKRDLLGYLLGKEICNVAEVKLLNKEEHFYIKNLVGLDDGSNLQNTYLVRLAGSYDLKELPCQSLEQAVATELVYSVWIRRRDTHADNRVYVRGIPVFFDHHIAFMAEPHYAHSTFFFKNQNDYGHPFYWRVQKINGQMDTLTARGVINRLEMAHHYVNDFDLLKKEIEIAEKIVKKIASSKLNQISKAGFTEIETEWVNNFLKNNLTTLNNDIDQMIEIIFREPIR